ncbi:MAG: hypothetical protein JWM49_513 [Microbacteriaceae bacterium]|jgi:hypothetical protein|nr:hypothetical protein [Microbacteriaceae bacterium]
MTTLTFTDTSPAAPGQLRPAQHHPGLTLVQLNDELWRVTRPTGEVLGYLEQFRVRAGLRYRAKRFIVRQNRFIEVGEFWSMDDAIDCFGF